ncbi:tetratricopeptide repeat protein [Niallia sp. 01092]|uniref:tetratricopeptide repeat protein n=1 Tax=unclassified Niallia TaxID=2837522 RepID=UPI003FD070B3
MKKRDLKKKDNIVFFPDLDQRLLEKGLEAIQEKNYHKAISFLKEALELNAENSEIQIGLIVSYYELGSLHEAKAMAKNMLDQGLGDYIHVLDLYLMILVQLHEYAEIVTTIEVLLEDHQIPANKIEHFSKMLDFSRRMALSENDQANEHVTRSKHAIEEKLDLSSIKDENEQMMLIAKLANQNIRSYMDEIKVYLLSEDGSPFLKTLLLNILKEQEYDKELTVHKFNRTINVIPIMLEDLQSQPQFEEINHILKGNLEHEDPVLLENIKALLERQFFQLYPFKLERFSNKAWAAAYHFVMEEYYGQEKGIASYSSLYGVNEADIEEAKTFIKSLEEISYPNI